MADTFLQRISRMSLGKIWRFLSKPILLEYALKTQAMSKVDLCQVLFDDVSVSEINNYQTELLTNHKFFHELNEKMIPVKRRRVSPMGWREFLYICIRILKPEIVFETGVFNGFSSAVILQALQENRTGLLISIDLPNAFSGTILPVDQTSGWVIPDYLKDRHQLLLGDSKELLPELFEKYPKIDIFLHDSLHTYEHMNFEFGIAWPHLNEGGLLLSDDTFWNSSFYKFAKSQNKSFGRLADCGFAALRK